METNFDRQPLAAKPHLLKQINYARILELLRCRAPITRAELARYSGLTRSTVTVITAELITKGLVRESGEMIVKPGGGRPGVGLSLNPDGAFFIGAAIEVEHITVVELNLAAQIVQRIQEPIEGSSDPERIFNQLVQLIDRVRQSNPLSQHRLRGVGLTVQGTLNLGSTVICAPFLGWHGVDLRRYLQLRINLPLFVDNDANAAALAEVYLGRAMQISHLLYLLINRGMGAGIVVNNQVFRGAYGTAGEIGSVSIEPYRSTRDDSSQQRDLGTSVGKETLLRRYRERGGKASDVNDLVAHLVLADPLTQAVVFEWAEILGWAIINLVNILNPEQIVIGGPLSALLPYVKNQLDAMLRDCVPGDGSNGFFSNPNSRLEASTFGEDASAVGGAVLVYQSLFQVPDLVLLQG